MSNKHRSFGIVLDEIQLQCTLWIIRQVERIHQAPFALQRIIGDFGTCHLHKPSLIRMLNFSLIRERFSKESDSCFGVGNQSVDASDAVLVSV